MKKYVLISLVALTVVSAEASVSQFFKRCMSKINVMHMFRKPKTSTQITELTTPAELAAKKDLVIWHDKISTEGRYPDAIWADNRFLIGLQTSSRIAYVPAPSQFESVLKQKSVVMQQAKQRLLKDY